MKRILFNIAFTLVFLLIFTSIFLRYSDTFIAAFTPYSKQLLPQDETIPFNQCQDWTQNVRQFDIKNGEQAEHVTVLMYHKIIPDNKKDQVQLHKSDTIVLKSEFAKQMNYLKQQGYVTLTAAEFQMFMEKKLNVPKKSVLITFDDGFKNNYFEAYPILKEHGFTAIDFVITSKIEKRESKYKGIGQQYFSEKQMLASCDVFDFQSHTYNFHYRTDEGTAFLEAKSAEEIKADITTSIHNLNKLEPIFAYPFGEFDHETIDALKQSHVKMAFTVRYQHAVPGMNMYQIPRKAVFPTDTIEDFIVKLNEP